MPVEYRPMTKEDLPEVIILMKQYGEEGSGFRYNPNRDTLSRRSNFLDNNPELSFVAEDEGKVIAMVFGSYDGGSTGYLTRLFVRPEHRRQGIGTEIMRLAKQKLNDRGCYHITIHIPKTNKPTLRIAEKLHGKVVEDFVIIDFKD